MSFSAKIFGIIFCVGAVLLSAVSCKTEQVKSEPAAPGANVSADNLIETRIAEADKAVFCLSVIVPGQARPRKRAVGTGFLVAENLIATAFHVKTDLEKAGEFYVAPKAQIIAWKKFDNGDYVEIPLLLAKSDENSDTAIYRFDEKILQEKAGERGFKPLKLAESLPKIGEAVLSIGYYGEMQFPFNSLGNVSMIDNGEDIYSDMTLMPGNSGSPLVSMKTGEVVGINIKVMTMGDGTIRLGISKRISKLKELIKDIKNNSVD